jgi:hypothetical protein
MGELCHQVHADPVVVDALRMVFATPRACCVLHGDADLFTEGPGDGRALHIHSVLWNDGIVPVHRLSPTLALRRILQEHGRSTDSNNTAAVIYSPNNSSICRLHLVDRCRFGEDCRLLHVCKHIVSFDHQGRQMQPSYITATPGSPDATPPYRHHNSMGPPSPLVSLLPPPAEELPVPPPLPVFNLSLDACPTPSTPESPGEATPGSFDYRCGSSRMRRGSIGGSESSSWTHEPYRVWDSLSLALKQAAVIEVA